MSRHTSSQTVMSLLPFQDLITCVMGILLLLTLLLSMAVQPATPPPPPVSAPAEAEVRAMEEKSRKLRDQLAAEKRRGDDLRKWLEFISSSTVSVEERLVKAKEQLSAASKEAESEIDKGKKAKDEAGQFRKDAMRARKELDDLIREHDKVAKQIEDRFGVRIRTLEEEIRKNKKKLETKMGELEKVRRNRQVSYRPKKGAKSFILIEIRRGKIYAQPYKGKVRSFTYRGPASLQQALEAYKNYDPGKYFVLLTLRPSNAEQADDLMKIVRDSKFELGYDLVLEDQVSVHMTR